MESVSFGLGVDAKLTAATPLAELGVSMAKVAMVTRPLIASIGYEWDSLEKARAFASSDELRERMQRAGVTGLPEVYFLDEADKPSA